MRAMLPQPPLMVITNRQMTVDLTATVAGALAGGARWVLLREKDMAPPARLDLARRLKGLTQRHAAHLGINGDAQAARSVSAEGLHLPGGQAPPSTGVDGLLLGASVHDVPEAEAAVAAGAGYLLLAPIFATESKTLHRPPLGLEGLRSIAETVPIPVVALGGITPDRAAACLEAGAAGVAAMGTIMRAPDPAATVRHYLKAMTR